MIKKCIFLTSITVVCSFSIAQSQLYEKKTVEAGASLSALSYYRFPSFANATVNLKDGGKLVSKMNFNLLICQMQFINPHGDTLNIAKPADIGSIIFDSSSFFYNDEGYYEILSAANSVKLEVLRKVNYAPVKIGALGLPFHNGTGIASYTSFLSVSGEKQLVMNEDVDILKETTFYLVDNNGEKFKATESNFLKVFLRDNGSIQAYIKENRFHFNRESDVKKLFDFCVRLH